MLLNSANNIVSNSVVCVCVSVCSMHSHQWKSEDKR